MKTLPIGMQDELDGGVTFMVHAYKVIRKDGQVFGFTSHDSDIVFEGVTYEADSGYTPSQLKATEGLNVDGMEAFGFLSSDRITAEDLEAGLYDDSEIWIYYVNWKDVDQRIILFRGNVGNVTTGRLAYIGEVRSMSHRLNQPTGRLHLHTCDVPLFSEKCGINPLDTSPLGYKYQFRGIQVASVTDRRVFSVIRSTLDDAPEGWFTKGIVKWILGANKTFEMEIKRDYYTNTHTEFELWEPMPYDIAVNDWIQLSTGCQKTCEICNAKFANILNFQGFPRMPNQDHVLVFAHREDLNNGGSLYS